MTVQRYPSFYDSQLTTVAVLEFENAALRREAGRHMTRRLASALAANGTYKVVGPDQLRARLAAIGSPPVTGADRQAAASTLQTLGGIDAFVTGTVREFAADRYTVFEPSAGYYSWWGRRSYRWGLGASAPLFRWTRTEASVVADAVLIRVSDQEVLHQTPEPVGARAVSSSRRTMTDTLLTQATDRAAALIVSRLAVVPVEVKLPTDKTLRTARRGEGEDDLTFTDDFDAGQDEMFVIVALPEEAAGNDFVIAVTRDGLTEILAELPFTWPRDRQSRRFALSPRELAETAGAGGFQVVLRSADQVVLSEDFDIDP